VNPATAILIPIHLKTGSNGKMIYKGLEKLLNRSGRLNRNKTWLEEIFNVFGVNIQDPSRFSVQRSRGTKHRLDEKVNNKLISF
jgi:hypothetical protein